MDVSQRQTAPDPDRSDDSQQVGGCVSLPDVPDRKDLREMREQIGVNQHELATEIDVDPSTISRWESGEYRLSLRDARRYVDALRRLRDSAE